MVIPTHRRGARVWFGSLTLYALERAELAWLSPLQDFGGAMKMGAGVWHQGFSETCLYGQALSHGPSLAQGWLSAPSRQLGAKAVSCH